MLYFLNLINILCLCERVFLGCIVKELEGEAGSYCATYSHRFCKNKVCVPVHGGGIFYTEREHMQKEWALMRQLTAGCVGSVGGRRAEKWAHGLVCHQRSVNSICRNDCDSRMPSASLNSR